MHEQPEIFSLDSNHADASIALPNRRTILAVGTEWEPREGGLSSFNKRICLALAGLAHRVYCFVPSGTVEAGSCQDGVNVISPGACLVHQQRQLGTLFRPPGLSGSDSPSIIVGHDYVTGPYAIALRQDYYPNAKVIIIVHVSQLELQYLKNQEGRDPGGEAHKKHAAQKEVVRAADIVVAVGPHLHDQTEDMIRELCFEDGVDEAPILPAFRLDPGLDTSTGRDMGIPANLVVLQIGRTEHLEQKGFDIAAKALGMLCGPERKVAFDVRGCKDGESGKIQEILSEWAGNESLRVRPQPFDPNPRTVRGDLGRASLLVMPSLEEGFGLVGLEAIGAGVPILVTARSGLAQLLKEKLGKEGAAPFIVDSEQPSEWASRIDQILQCREVAFQAAQQLRDGIGPDLTWQAAAEGLEQAWESRLSTE